VTRRLVGVLAGPAPAPPPGIDAVAWRDAMLEDVIDLVTSMQQVEPVLIVCQGDRSASTLVWPGTPIVTAPERPTVTEALDAVAALGADEVGVVCADAPDLPALLLGKLHSALTSAAVAVCPAQAGLVAVAARVPLPGWLVDSPSLDDADALARLRALAPRRGLAVGAGWHRVRGPADVARLDPGLEGWEATRALLSA
jgi:hypothetical protein